MNVRRSGVLPIEARPWVVLVLAVILSTSALPALATGTCTGEGPGLHAFDPDDDESGVGGTGRAPTPRAVPLLAEDDDENGVGGTGVHPSRRGESGAGDENGIGGTGLLGPIRVLESSRGSSKPGNPRRDATTRICLNGLEIEVPDALALESSGGEAASHSTDLVSGRMAWVEAQTVDGDLVATRVLLAEDRIGWTEVAERGDASGRRRPPMARQGSVSKPTRHPGGMLEGVGDWRLRVSGVGVLVSAETLVHQDVVGRTRPTFRKGSWIRYQGFQKNANVFVATRIDLAPKGRSVVPETTLEERVAERLRAEPATRPEYVSIEGYVTGTAERREIAERPIVLPEHASVDAREALAPGRRVRIGGIVGRDGEIIARPPPTALRPQRTQLPRPGVSPGDGSGRGADDRPKPSPGDSATPPTEPGRPVRVDRPDGMPPRPVDRPTRIAPGRPQIAPRAIDRLR